MGPCSLAIRCFAAGLQAGNLRHSLARGGASCRGCSSSFLARCRRGGATKQGKRSQQTQANTGPRRFLVIEQDAGASDEQAAVLVHLAARVLLALALPSGGKSIHGWFRCAGRTEATASKAEGARASRP